MKDSVHKAIAVVGLGAVLPDAPDVPTFWENIKSGRYSISETPKDRWDPDLYFDPDPEAPEKTYSKIGGWVGDFNWDPFAWKLPIPPKVGEAMDRTQKWAIMATREALADFGYPDRALDPDRTAVILGNAMAGDQHYMTTLRLMFPEYAEQLAQSPAFAALAPDTQQAITEQLKDGMAARFPGVTEDTMPGELGNIIAGRVANLFDFHGPNYIVDAACASAMAAMSAAIEGLEEYDYDAVIAGGIDANMSASTFIKFCKIGALSATGTRPYADGADGFVMGEGSAVFLLKRLEDAERDGDTIQAVIRGFGGASDGKGKGITAPNPVGQKLAVKRAWIHAGVDPSTVGLIEGHGTSTRVGDVVELESLNEVFSGYGLPAKSVPLGSVKSNIGHLKAGAGAAGILKAILALRDKVIPPSLNFERPNPNADWESSPFYVSTELAPWEPNGKEVRRAGASAFGFGGTNFHAVMEEYIPGRIQTERRAHTATKLPVASTQQDAAPKAPLRGALVVGGATEADVRSRLEHILERALAGDPPPVAPPAEADLRADVRVAVDYGDAAELAGKIEKTLTALETAQPMMWKALANQGVFLGRGGAPLIAFLYTGQGSQYVNMMRDLREVEPIVERVFARADEVMTPLLDGRSLSSYIFVDADDRAAVAAAEMDLLQTEITQPAVLATDAALTEMLASYGIHPDMVMGHSLGEYGALISADALPFEQALEAVSARGREMASLTIEDNGQMSAVFGPLTEVKRIVEETDGYVVVANNNSHNQAVIGGASEAVVTAGLAMLEAGMQVVPLPVSHAFHTEIVAPASAPLRDVLARLDLRTPAIPIVANLTGEFYPVGPNVVPQMIDILGQQVASPVQFVDGLHTLYEAGARVFIEVGPKKALAGFVEDVLGDRDDVVSLFSNHPKQGGAVSFNQALCGLYAAGFGVGTGAEKPSASSAPVAAEPTIAAAASSAPAAAEPTIAAAASSAPGSSAAASDDTLRDLGQMFADFLEQGYARYRGTGAGRESAAGPPSLGEEPVVVTGAALGLPGTPNVFDDENLERILEGQVFVDAIPVRFRNEMANRSITRLVKGESGASFETIDSVSDVIKLAGRQGAFDFAAEFGYPADRVPALDVVTQLAIAAGLDALRDAGIPLVLRYKTTTTGSQLPDRWMLPEELRDDTAVIFGSAFPGADSIIDEVNRFHHDRERKARLEELGTLKRRAEAHNDDGMIGELDHHIRELEHHIEQEPYNFDRRFLFRALSMGHSQFAEYIGARGPNTQINSACASTTQAVALAEDWIRTGRCTRAIIVSADDVTTETLMGWVGSGFLASGAAATDEVVEDAVIPFDRRRHGLVLGMGAAAIVVERADAARQRGLTPICEVLSTVTANSAFHGTRLDVDHIRHVMNQVVEQAEERWGIDRRAIAPHTVFMSHETYTPARGGSAQAEVDALRHTFGERADDIVVANTKGFTGHAMGTGIEDVVAIKSLETGLVPPVPNLKEPDPELGFLNLSAGGTYPVEYALRLGAGFGSQVSLSLIRRVAPPTGRRFGPHELGYDYRVFDRTRFDSWLRRLSGYDAPALEVSQRTLRIADQGAGAATAVAEPSAARLQPSARVEHSAPKAPPAPVAVPAAEPAAESPPPAEEPASEPVAGGRGLVEDAVLAVVAAQTGYPVEMLEMDLDLEADLGIDTVKQ
ncbi:MAG: acyltransferase domain-containing protein, partial [Acidimicrobiia bacterium]|nr:acyltransferase domain-containing protein [Acidimicrobiia bacterium]